MSEGPPPPIGKKAESNETPVEVGVARPEEERDISNIQFRSSLIALVSPERGATEEWVRSQYTDYGPDGKLTEQGEQNLQGTIEHLRQNASPDSEAFVARENGKVIGFCTVSKSGERNRLVGIYTDPDIARKGLGTKLWEQARQFLDPEKETVVTLMDYNTRAYDFYLRLGFQDFARRQRAEVGKDGVNAELIDMVRPAERPAKNEQES